MLSAPLCHIASSLVCRHLCAHANGILRMSHITLTHHVSHITLTHHVSHITLAHHVSHITLTHHVSHIPLTHHVSHIPLTHHVSPWRVGGCLPSLQAVYEVRTRRKYSWSPAPVSTRPLLPQWVSASPHLPPALPQLPLLLRQPRLLQPQLQETPSLLPWYVHVRSNVGLPLHSSIQLFSPNS